MVCCDMTPSPELILFNGSVITCRESEDSDVTAVAVSKGHISAMGSDSDMLSLAKAGYTRAIDLKGNCLMPGFIDCNSNFGKSIYLRGTPDVSSARTMDQVFDIMKNKFPTNIKKDQILMARGYDHTAIQIPSGAKHITCRDLDAAFPHTPVGLFHYSLQGVILNSRALDILDIDKHTVVPEGGVIAKDSHGELTGGLWNTALTEYSSKLMNAMRSELSLDDRRKLIHEAQVDYATYGYTTIQDGCSDIQFCHWLVELAKDKRIFLDLIALPSAKDMDSVLSDLKFNTYFNKVKFGGINFVLDGNLHSKNAYMGKPYKSGSNGQPVINATDLNRQIKRVVESGLQAYAECHGDEAIDMYLNALEMAGVKSDSKTRHVILHAMVCRDDQLQICRKYNLITSFLTNALYVYGDAISSIIGDNRVHDLCPMKSAQKHGVTFTNHSDYILTPLNPLMQIHTSVNRKSKTNHILGADQAVDVLTAIKAVTINGAKQYHEESIKGSLDIGKLADFAVLSKNPMQVPHDKIQHIKVQMTFKDGVEVFNRRKLPLEKSEMMQKERLFNGNKSNKAACY